MKVIIKDGKIFEYDGENIKSYGNNFIEAIANDDLVIALDKNGRVHEYRNGKKIKSYGIDLIKITLKNGIVIGNDKNNFCYEFIDGLKNRTYPMNGGS
jgi:hypothetical protein